MLFLEDILYYDPAKVVTPVSLNEIQSIIRKARSMGQKIRPLGAGHSWNTLVMADDIFLSLFNYRGLVSVNVENKQSKTQNGRLERM